MLARPKASRAYGLLRTQAAQRTANASHSQLGNAKGRGGGKGGDNETDEGRHGAANGGTGIAGKGGAEDSSGSGSDTRADDNGPEVSCVSVVLALQLSPNVGGKGHSACHNCFGAALLSCMRCAAAAPVLLLCSVTASSNKFLFQQLLRILAEIVNPAPTNSTCTAFCLVQGFLIGFSGQHVSGCSIGQGQVMRMDARTHIMVLRRVCCVINASFPSHSEPKHPAAELPATCTAVRARPCKPSSP